jgi:hypothetical protein
VSLSEFTNYLRDRYPDARITPLSSTNNQIYTVEQSGSVLSAKLVTDTDIPLSYFAACSVALGQRILVPAVVDILQVSHGAPFDAIIADYVHGRDLSSSLSDPLSNAADGAAIVDFMLRYIDAVAGVKPLFAGFGLFKNSAQPFADHHSFLLSFARKYFGRVAPFMTVPDRLMVDQWLEKGLAAASEAPMGYQCVGIDSNLRNFVITADHSLALLNVPIVGWSTRAHAVAAISAHLRPFPIRAEFLARATDQWSGAERAAVDHLEAWTLLGILSFYAVRAPDDPASWRNWGAERNLKDDFIDIIRDIV